jgi:hypothetical protein
MLHHSQFFGVISLAIILVLTVAVRVTSDTGPTQPASAMGTCEERPTMYRLDANYHQLPERFVRDFLTRPPPTSRLFQPEISCETSSGPEGQLSYCLCFGAVPCANLGASGRCSAPVGLHPSGRIGVCRSTTAGPFQNPCDMVERVTVG